MKSKNSSYYLIAVGFLFALVSAYLIGYQQSPKKTKTKTVKVNSEYASVIKDAAVKLRDTYTDYIVSNTLDTPEGNVEYIEVSHENENYTEYSVDADGNFGTIKYGSAETVSYTLSDWLTSDNKYYMFSSNEDGDDIIYSFPDSYSNYISDRSMLYVNELVDGALDIKVGKDMTVDIGNGDETLKTYEVKVSRDVIKEIFGVQSWGIYKSILEEEGESSNIGKLCKYYLQDLDMNLTFSDANVIVGIDNNNILKYMSLEAGGLGSRVYFTKAVVSVTNDNIRTIPDFTNATKYSTSMTELADYVAQFDSYDDALEAMYGQGVEENEKED